MGKTRLTVITALVLSALSVGLIVGRHRVLRGEIDGTPGAATWRVALTVEGELTAVNPANATVVTALPPDFRRQHVVDEHFDSGTMAHVVRTAKDGGPRRALWRGRNGGGKRPLPFRLTYTFRCVTGMRQPTPGMVMRTHALDGAPGPEGRETRPAPQVESDHPDVAGLADRLAGNTDGAEERVRELFDHVADLGAGEAVGALATAQAGAGSAAGKSRLLVAMCRSLHVPARTVHGLLLTGDGPQLPHTWAEAWVDSHWLPMDPDRRLFGAARFPGVHLALAFDAEPVRAEGARIRYAYAVTDLHNSLAPEGGAPPSAARKVWRKMSLGNLRPEEQSWVKLLLLLPVAALVVSVFRTMIGVTTFGTFGPALLGLVCRDPADFPWALGVFVGLMLAGWAIRRALDRYHLLMVPRVSVMLTCIVALLVVLLMLAGTTAGATRGYVALLPLIILTHMVERFWTVEAEDGTAASFRTLFWTVVVSVTVAVVVNFDQPVNAVARLLKHGPAVQPDVVRLTLFRYPEALGLALAGQLLIGRYTGYRLTELFRFRDLLLEEPEAHHEPAGAGEAVVAKGHPGDEPAKHRVHPGPEPAVVLPGGGQQEENARPVRGDGRADA